MYICIMKKTKRRYDEHIRGQRMLLLRNDLYAIVEQVAYDKGHSMSSFVEEWMEKISKERKR